MASRTQALAEELKHVIRLAARDPEALEGTLPTLSGFARVPAAGAAGEPARVHFILYRLIPDYAARLPAGRDGRAVRELLTWEDADGDTRSLTTRYHRASAHLVNAADDFGRRQEPRLLLECARRFIALDHEDRLAAGAAADAASPPPAALVDDPALSPLTPLLWTKAEEDHRRRLEAIRGGIFAVSNQEEVLELLLTMTQVAQHSLHAVDQTDLERWFGNARLRYYLEAQLERARADRISVQRLRFIRHGALDDARERVLLREFIRLHDEAGATLALCPADAAHELGTGFDARMFMVIVDIETAPACLTAQLGELGYIERSLVYLRELDPVRTHYADLLRVREHARRMHYDESVRALLVRHDDPPPADADQVAHPPWSPLAPPG
ncbi:MAG: hypothetical protein QOG42_2013 [Solirubrobacteraceae bacterium]|nr:hypothetical protein [Solirubrobacteraceae bacterium]